VNTLIAWDIETVPQPIGILTESQRQRLELDAKYQAAWLKERGSSQDPHDRAMSLHPYLGWICCLVAVSCTFSDKAKSEENPDGAVIGNPKSYAAETIDGECILLESFWDDIAGINGMPLWITFNGKRFDVPYLRIRTIANGLRCRRIDLLHTNPWANKPHVDLSCIGSAKMPLNLDNLCDARSSILGGCEKCKKELREMHLLNRSLSGQKGAFKKFARFENY